MYRFLTIRHQPEEDIYKKRSWALIKTEERGMTKKTSSKKWSIEEYTLTAFGRLELEAGAGML